ncbi:hypothetical protein CAC42_3682 [Sphaceloma murrayae]|uniref:Mso1 N-terminal domain-containing protein n=1 Tax=Sphaceloma murrayae TaxID=2082308 RepID=A0A2K1QGU9_9PEZI|nr:hypothetical protein CAC42_3682 [Sphaceloma murrayae]
MSGYLSNLLTSTTDRYNSLRRNLLTSEGDGDTEDDSHICRVLRAYYTEKSRPLPDWLPPDPKKVVTQPPVQPSTIGSSYANLWNSSTPAPPQPSPMLSTSANNSRSALSDLWDAPAQPARGASPVSLRAGRQPLGGAQHLAPQQANVRPLPSQRAGSYQTIGARGREGTAGPAQGFGAAPAAGLSQQQSGGSGGAGGTAQERLKARLWGQAGGGRAASPGFPQGGGQYGSGAGGGGGGGGGYGGRY